MTKAALTIDRESAIHDFERDRVVFRAVAGAIAVRCVVTAAALTDVSGSGSVHGLRLIALFRQYAGAIREAVRHAFEENRFEDGYIVIRTADLN